ncbi:MAG: hypothetical protein HZA79_17115 [Sphingobacteriales bacterium]|nr:hypothetical protein [Sphingobacteriales bacterium]
MFKKWSICLAFLYSCVAGYAQGNPADTAILKTDSSLFALDSTIDYDALFRDFDAFMDSLLTPRSYSLLSLSVGKGYYNYSNKTTYATTTAKKLNYSPTLGYYHKNGLGITGTGYLVHDGENLNFYQAGITPSYDYLQNRSIATGISYTRYLTKDSLPFYTTPLQNELYGYFMYRKSWFKPSVSLSYGWGSRSDYMEREEQIQDLRLRRRGYTYVNTEETVSDFSVMASLRHDFYWLEVLADRDHIRLTPQLAFTSGTQKFGFNQSSGTYATSIRTGNNILFNTDNVYLDDQIDFQPLSLTMFLRGEYSIGKFFIQPQLVLDYYFPADTKNFNALFSLNAGFFF